MGKPGARVPRFAAFLKERSRGRSLKQVSNAMRAVGVTRVKSAISRYQNQARVPSVDALRGFSAAYHIPFEELVDRLLEELGVKPVEWRIRELSPREQRAWTKADDWSKRAALAVLRLGRGAEPGQPPPDRPLSQIRLVDFMANDDGATDLAES